MTISYGSFCLRIEPFKSVNFPDCTEGAVEKGSFDAELCEVQAAWAAVRAKLSYLQARFLRLKSRRDPKKAIIAVATSMLTAVYHMLTRAVPYHDLGPDHFERRDHAKLAQRLVRRLRALGFTVAFSAPPPGLASSTSDAR